MADCVVVNAQHYNMLLDLAERYINSVNKKTGRAKKRPFKITDEVKA